MKTPPYPIILIGYLAFTILKHLQRFLNLHFIISQLTQMTSGLQVFQDLSTTYNNSAVPSLLSSNIITQLATFSALRKPVFCRATMAVRKGYPPSVTASRSSLSSWLRADSSSAAESKKSPDVAPDLKTWRRGGGTGCQVGTSWVSVNRKVEPVYGS